MARLFEKIVFQQFYDYFDSNNFLSNSQSGFRPLHSTLSALLEATNDWCMNIDKGLLNGVIFIDLKKAFNTTDHNILAVKLKKYGDGRNALTWIKSYLDLRTQRCKVNGHLSNAKQITCGVPQGSILGPPLFFIYINDLPNCLQIGCARM